QGYRTRRRGERLLLLLRSLRQYGRCDPAGSRPGL
ncbi:MAG: hypothetical protein AVDCRST_MAG28-1834, partial [uncultured Rubrobacteraceae bacterium]